MLHFFAEKESFDFIYMLFIDNDAAIESNFSYTFTLSHVVQDLIHGTSLLNHIILHYTYLVDHYATSYLFSCVLLFHFPI